MTVTAPARPVRHRSLPAALRAAVALVATLTVIVAGLAGLFAPPASAQALRRPETRVAAFGPAGGQIVGAHPDIPAGQRRARAPDYDQLTVGSCVAAETVSSGYNPANLGQSYGGRAVVEDPQIDITGFQGSANPNTPFHALDQAITRGVSPQAILNTVRNPIVVLEQGGGSSYMYLSDQAAVVIRPNGQIVTTWGSAQFNPTTSQILQDAQRP